MTGTYTVVAGDTLSEIAQKLGIPMESLVEWNDIEDPSHIVVGQALVLSDPDASTAKGKSYVVQPGDTFSEIGREFGVPYQEIMQANGYTDPTKLQAGSTITIPYRTYKVAAGNTFSEIGQKFGVPYEEVMTLNGYEDPTSFLSVPSC